MTEPHASGIILLMDNANSNGAAAMTFKAFEKLYRSTFKAMMSYSPNEVGSAVYVEKMASLADDYPEWAEQVENEWAAGK